MEAAVTIHNLTVTYGDYPALDQVSLEIADKQLTAIIGPNGGGKSTLLKAILGLVRPSGGTIAIFGEKPERALPLVGYVPQYSQSDRQFPINVLQTVLLGLLGKRPFYRPYTGAEIRKAEAMLDLMHLADYTGRQIGALSEGQRQRVFIARALMTDPRLLLLDEPTASIDQNMQQSIFGILKDMKQRIAIVMVTHDVSSLSAYVDTVVCLNRRTFYHGDPELSADAIDQTYGCPVDLIAHGYPHRVFREHDT